MPKFLPVRTSPNCAIAVCDRCHTKVYLAELQPDGNSPGLRVCKSCWDVKDPYRLPPRRPDHITVQHPRPFAPPPLVSTPLTVGTEYGEAIDFPPEIEL